MRKKTFVAFQFHFPPALHPYILLLTFTHWLHEILTYKGFEIHHTAPVLRRARGCRDVRHCSTMCSAFVIWAESPNVTESGKCINTMKWDHPPPAHVSQLCLPSFPLIILCSFEIINMQGWHGLYSGFRQSTAVSACLLKHFIYHLPYRCEVEP